MKRTNGSHENFEILRLQKELSEAKAQLEAVTRERDEAILRVEKSLQRQEQLHQERALLDPPGRAQFYKEQYRAAQVRIEQLESTHSAMARDGLREEIAQLRATNARLTAALEWISKGPTFGPGAPSGIEQAAMQSHKAKDALSSDASQDLACVRDAIRALRNVEIDDWIHRMPSDICRDVGAALSARFGGGQ